VIGGDAEVSGIEQALAGREGSGGGDQGL
jgi:hypothetical protein